MEAFLIFVWYAIPLAFLVLLMVWTATDAEKRGKNPVLVCVFVIVTFPFGLLAWVLFRPPETPNKPFNLQDYRTG